MDIWTLEKAKNGFSEVVRRALRHQPQMVTCGRRGEHAVVVVAREDYEQLVAPRNVADFLRESPVAEAVASGELKMSVDELFARPRDAGHGVTLD